MFKEVKGYKLNNKEYETSIMSHSFLNRLNLFFGHIVIWIYALFFIYALNFTVGIFNTTIPHGRLFHNDAFDLVLTVVSFYIVIDLLVVCFSRTDDYRMRVNATTKKRNIVGAFWLICLPIFLYTTHKRNKR